ncbi:MAG: hypothetical protein JW726_19670 [Anaerolineales bacterium]|nr:hypothetical protein [Anaerolineales bacterium]
MRNRLIKTWLLPVLLLCLALACGESSATETPAIVAPPPAAGGEVRCGDGVCDDAEQANPDLCPQDCASPELTAVPMPTAQVWRASTAPMWTSYYGDCPGRQVDDIFVEFEFTWSVDQEGVITGSGEGTMYAEAVSRCPDTEYGGIRTPDPFPVTVSGSADDNYWNIDLVANDLTQAYFTNGEVYHEECMLCWVMPQFEGVNISGTLASFALPRNAQVGDQFTFEMDYHVPQSTWVNDHIGSAVLEILEVSP